MDRVFIRDLEIATVIGAFDWEQQIKQAVTLNLEMAADVRTPGATDNLDDALDYGVIIHRLKSFIGNSRVLLVETLAERIAALLMTEFGVQWLRLELGKPRPLSGHHIVGVIIERGAPPEYSSRGS
jgi:dihydroneopterin aldolase